MYQSSALRAESQDQERLYEFVETNENPSVFSCFIEKIRSAPKLFLLIAFCSLCAIALFASYNFTKKEVMLRSPAILNHHGHHHSHSHKDEKFDKEDQSSSSENHHSTKNIFQTQSIRKSNTSSALLGVTCEPPYPGYPYCEDKVNELSQEWNKDPQQMKYYTSQGVDGTKCSFLNYLNTHGFYCPEAADYAKEKIRGVNLGGWLVLEPWITPSLFEQFPNSAGVVDQWTFCEQLGKKEARRQLEKHWDTWVTEDDLATLAKSGINHVRIPVGYWMFGDIKEYEPWVDGDLPYLERVLKWCKKYNLHAVLDLHTGPGSQNGFDNSGRKGDIHFDLAEELPNGRTIYPNIDRALKFIEQLTQHFVGEPYTGTVVAIEPINEAFVTIPIQIVKDYYLRAYEIVKSYVTPETGDIAVIIGDSFRWGAPWNDFMLPPHYRHVWIDTHIYHVFDMRLLSMNWSQHIDKTCSNDKSLVEIAPLSTVVGEWSLATTDCAHYLNGYRVGTRFEGQLPDTWRLGSCEGESDPNTYTLAYRKFLREFAEKQMDAYESGSSEGWFFWCMKNERAPEWNYLLGLREGWIPAQSERTMKCT